MKRHITLFLFLLASVCALGQNTWSNTENFAGNLSLSQGTYNGLKMKARLDSIVASFLNLENVNTSDFNVSSGRVLSIDYTNGQAASSSTKGFLTSTDWSTFNNKGNVTGTGANTRIAFWTGTSSQSSDEHLTWDTVNHTLKLRDWEFLAHESSGASSLYIGNQGATNPDIYTSPGAGNTGIGLGAFGALAGITSGQGNVGLGVDAGRNITEGFFNIAIGDGALDDITTGSDNVAVGAGALGNATGELNTALGSGVGQTLTGGNFNIIIGSLINFPSTSASGQLVIGNVIFGAGNNIVPSTGLEIPTGNLGFYGLPTGGFEGMERGLFIAENNDVPTSAPAGGAFMYVDGGDVKIWNEGAGSPFTVGSGGGVSDGDKGDITVSSSGTTWTIDNTAVSFAKIQNADALSVVGRSTNSSGVLDEIAAGSDHNILRRSGTSIGFGSIDLSQSGAVGSSVLPVANGGTNASTADGARTSLGVQSRTLWIDNSSSGLTGSTSETKVASFQIPANTLGANDIIEIFITATKSGTAGSMTPRVYFNTSDAVGGTQVAVNSSIGSNLWNSFVRRGVCKNATNAQVWYNLSNANDDVFSTNSAKLSTSIDFTATQYIVISNQLGNSSDTGTVESVTLRIYRQ